MPKKPEITCPKCEGTGLVKLPKTYVPTLNALKKYFPQGATAPVLHDKLKADQSISNTNNHLEALRSLGFVDRKRKNTKSWIYYAV